MISLKPYVVTPHQYGSDEGSQHMFLCTINKKQKLSLIITKYWDPSYLELLLSQSKKKTNDPSHSLKDTNL